MKTVVLKSLTGTNQLIGRDLANVHFPRFATAAMAVDEGTTIVWDWACIDVVTASYVAGTFVPLIRQIGSGKSGRYFIFAGLNKHCLDELSFVLKAEKVATLVAPSIKRIQSLDVVGHLDPAYVTTLVDVLKRKSVSAKVLHQQKGESNSIGLTGWIKRLTTLNELGLVRRRKVGREYLYEATYI